MSRIVANLVAAGCILACVHARVLGDAVSDYQSLFGEDEAKVAASHSTKDAADFAGKLLSAAQSLGDQKPLQALLCEKAYEFGMKSPSGLKTAVDAVKLLIEAAPDKKPQALEKLVKAARVRYARTAQEFRRPAAEELVNALVACAADHLAAKRDEEALTRYREAFSVASAEKMDQAKELMETILKLGQAQAGEKRLADLKARLAKDPKDAAARLDLILAYLGEADTPAEAARLVTRDLDEAARTYVPLAAGKIEDLKEPACLELAQWYAQMAEKTPPPGKGVLLGKAKACCERYLALHSSHDVLRLKCSMLLEKVAKGATWPAQSEQGVAAIPLAPDEPAPQAKPVAAPAARIAPIPAAGSGPANLTDRTDVDEYQDLANHIVRGHARKGLKVMVDLVACYDAVKFTSSVGKPAKVKDSYAPQVLVGTADGILVHGPRATSFEQGSYCVGYRMKATQRLPDQPAGLIDAASDGKTIASHDLPIDLFGEDAWSIPFLTFDIKKRQQLEFRVWSRNFPLAVDRIYVFRQRVGE